MKAVAKHWIKVDNVWYRAGEEYEIPETSEKKAEEVAEEVTSEAETLEPEKPKTRRRKKTEE